MVNEYHSPRELQVTKCAPSSISCRHLMVSDSTSENGLLLLVADLGSTEGADDIQVLQQTLLQSCNTSFSECTGSKLLIGQNLSPDGLDDQVKLAQGERSFKSEVLLLFP